MDNKKIINFCEFNQSNVLNEESFDLLDELFNGEDVYVSADENNNIKIEDNNVILYLDEDIANSVSSHQNKNICEFSSDYLFEYLQKNDVNLLLETAEQTLNVEYDVLTNYFQTYIRNWFGNVRNIVNYPPPKGNGVSGWLFIKNKSTLKYKIIE